MTEYNIEEGMPTVAEAMDSLKSIINRARSAKQRIIIIIHGYGSSGRGGAIQSKARQWLKAQERNLKLKAVIYGEEFNMFNDMARKIKDIDGEVTKHYGKGNNGITVVAL